jgi:uroporphyrinogen decarboxylase
MTSKQRFLKALNREIPDRLPTTTHHVMPYFLKTYMNGISYQEFFDYFGLDPILWVVCHKPMTSQGHYLDPEQKELDFLQAPRICSDNWQIKIEHISNQRYKTVKYFFGTPKKTLTMLLQSDEHTTWVTERMVKEKSDIDIFAEFAPIPVCDVEEVNRQARSFGEKGLVRGSIPGFDVYGQPGCWQDAAVFYGIEKLIMETFYDPEWVHKFLKILMERKKVFVSSTHGAKFDLIEHGGGDASSTVISPKIFDEFVAPYDSELIAAAHKAGQRIVYHTCGGMMAFLERIADMNPDVMETFTPAAMAGDANLREAKKRIGQRVCMIGGFDQFHFFKGCRPEETRKEVRRCFEEAGQGGGYILAPSDHFFDADLELIRAYADEARRCIY